jgi:hypothetical protein
MKTRILTQAILSFGAFALLGLAVAGTSAGCGSASLGAGDDAGDGSGGCNPAYTMCAMGGSSGGSGGTGTFTGDGSNGFSAITCAAGSGKACINTMCGTGDTTISGTVLDPAGKNPLYDIAVYVPSVPPDPITLGATCDTCSSLYTGKAIASALTDAAGHFVIHKAPSSPNPVPLVVQVGKWRKQVTIKSGVAACQDTGVGNITLPKNRKEGDIPNIAVSTGGADSLECLLRRIGIDASEYGGGANGNGAIHIFTGFNGAVTTPTSPTSYSGLWPNKTALMKYDIVILSCEGAETANISVMSQQALFDYANSGGRIFASHFHYAWFIAPPGFNSGPFSVLMPALATWTTGTQTYMPTDSINTQIVTTLNGSTNAFPKGVAMKQWLGNVHALTGGALPITQAKHNALVGPANSNTQAWIATDGTVNPPNQTMYFSVNAPFGVSTTAEIAGQCGRIVYADLHVSGGPGSGVGVDYQSGLPIVPDGCAPGDLSPQEKALEFMLFDLSACVTPNTDTPMNPPIQ